jgi:hypothetical protein
VLKLPAPIAVSTIVLVAAGAAAVDFEVVAFCAVAMPPTRNAAESAERERTIDFID